MLCSQMDGGEAVTVWLVARSVTCRASLTMVEIPYHLPSYELVGWVNYLMTLVLLTHF